MKKLTVLFFLICTLGIFNSYAQQGYKAAYIAGGITYEKGGNGIIGIDFPSNSYHSFVIEAQYFQSNKEKNFLGGIGYKYCFNKSVNSMFRGKIAGMVGTTSHQTIFAPVGGFEYIYALSPVVDLMFMTDAGYYFNSEQRWRVNTFLGLRFNF